MRGMAGVIALCAASSAGQVAMVPPAVDAHLLADVLDDDVRILAMGDSYCVSRWDRVFPGVLRVWPFEDVTALAQGASLNGALRGVVAVEPSQRVDADFSYELLRSTPEIDHFALPVRSIEEAYLDENILLSGPQRIMYAMRVNNDDLAIGETGRFTDAGDAARFRLLYWAPETQIMLPDAGIYDKAEARGTVDLRFGARQLWSKGGDPSTGVGIPAFARQINATATDVEILNGMDEAPTARIGEGSTPAIGSNTYFHFAGGLFYKVDAQGERLPGTYYSYLADSSWSYAGFGSDTPANGPQKKVFSLEQLTHWLDVTTIDRSQRLVVFYYLAAEDHSLEETTQLLEAMIDQTTGAAEAVGIDDVTHCLTIPYLHKIGDRTIEESAPLLALNRDAAYAVAGEREDVAALSIFDATDHVAFDGSEEAKAWLLERGYDSFTYGSVTVDLVNGPHAGKLLDVFDSHPADADAAAFFASILGDLLPLCDADCNGDGTLNVLDYVCFTLAWKEQLPAGDCDGNGAFDVLDFVCFTLAFETGCGL